MSSLPPGAFGSCDADVEHDISGAAGEVLLRHLARIPDELDAFEELEKSCTRAPAKDDGRNAVDPEELWAAASWFTELATAVAPDLGIGQDAEHLGVLSDLATHGEGLSRQAASRRLLHAASDHRSLAAIDTTDRRRMLERLADLHQSDGLRDANLLLLCHALGRHADTTDAAVPDLSDFTPQSAVPTDRDHALRRPLS